MKSAIHCLLLLALSLPVSSQTTQVNAGNFAAPPFPELFKTLPPLDAETPDWALLLYSEDPNAYEVDQLYLDYYSTRPFKKTVHTQNYKFWRRQVGKHLDDQGFYRPPSREEEDQQFLQLKNRKNEQAAKGSLTNWSCLGPFETYKTGTLTPYSSQVNVYALDQSDSNPNLLFCGTEAGGVFKSTDKGLNWSLVSQSEVFVTVTAVQIHPDNGDIVFTCHNKHIYRTLDGGSSWQEVFYLGGTGSEIKFKPDAPDTILCASTNGLFRSTDGGTSWSTVFTNQTWDVDFHPTNPDSVYCLRNNTALVRAEVFVSADAGATWTLKDNGWYSPADPANAIAEGGKIAIPPGNPNRIYACLIGNSKAGDNGWIGVYVSNDRGESWTLPAGQTGGPYQPANTMPWNVAAYSDGYHQGFYNFDMEASHKDPNTIWIGTIRLSESADGALTFQSIGAAESQRLSDIHADIQSIEVNGDDIWIASDGGINYSTDELMSHASRKNGIAGSDFWGFGSGWNEDALVGGRYHNGNHAYYQTYDSGKGHTLGGAEEATGYVHPMEARRAIFSEWWAGVSVVKKMPGTLGGNSQQLPSVNILPNEHYLESYSSGIYFDPRYADHLYVGEGSKIWKSKDGGNTFQTLHDFGSGSRTLEIAISRSQPDSLYVVFKPSGTNARQIFRSHDGGLSWVQLPVVPTNNRNKLEITLNPANAAEIWVCANDGANGNKVFQSLDGGNTWINRTTAALDGEHPKDIFFQGGTNGVVYLATNNSVFYRDPTLQDWVDYGAGLPLIINTLQLQPFYRDSKLRLASTGRGIWEAPLAVASAPLAQPMTFADTLYCSRDTAYFDSYSIVDQAGVSWLWSFSPEPLYVSSTTARNPKVVFGANGSYTVSLSVTDGTGQSNTKTLQNMVTVRSRCEPETTPGNAVLLQNAGDWVQTSALNVTTSELTLTAWIKPEGIQDAYSGIVINDGDVAGFNFRENNNTLGYHYPGGAWWWDSGLEVPSGEWSHVAMVVKPTGVTVYVNGKGATDTRSLNPLLLTSLKIGSYRGWSSRNVRGEIDEVSVWQKALTQAQIRELMHLTLEGQVGNPDLLLYYQFNEEEGKALNRAAPPLHASLMGGATRTLSLAPVGGGSSERQTVNAGGVYDFAATGVKMGFPAAGVFPNGELVTYRLNLPPDELPSSDSLVGRRYWIIRNFGTNQAFSALDSLVFEEVSPLGVVPADSLLLFKRASNAFGPTWGSSVDKADLLKLTAPLSGNITFSNGLNLSSFSQFAMTRPPVYCSGLALTSPPEGAVLDNGCADLSDNVQWLFAWNACPGTTVWELDIRPGGSQALPIASGPLTGNTFLYNEMANYTATASWKARVRGFRDGLWTPYSSEISFSLEASGTDCSNPCAGASLVLDATPLVPNEYRAVQSISSQGSVVSGASVLFQAGDSVQLGAGFEVNAGAVFQVLMSGCN